MTKDHFIEATKALIVDRTKWVNMTLDRSKWVNKVMVLEKDPISKFTNGKLVAHSDQFIKTT